MKEWPKDNKCADFESLLKPFLRAIKFAYTLKRKNQDKDIPYKGYNHNVNHICLPIDERLTAAQLEYDKDEQGRDALEVIIGAAMQVGLEQGRRHALDSDHYRYLLLMEKIAKNKLGMEDD